MLNTVKLVIANIFECLAHAGTYKHFTYINVLPPLYYTGHRLSYNPS